MEVVAAYAGLHFGRIAKARMNMDIICWRSQMEHRILQILMVFKVHL